MFILQEKMDTYIQKVEHLCTKLCLKDIPALKQLRIAKERNDKKSMKRIADNIMYFISSMEKSNEASMVS